MTPTVSHPYRLSRGELDVTYTLLGLRLRLTCKACGRRFLGRTFERIARRAMRHLHRSPTCTEWIEP